MALEWLRFIISASCLVTGLIFMIMAVFGVNRYHRALYRIHMSAMGDTLGILFVFAGLIIMKGLCMGSLKFFIIIAFFWIASPVSGHMISRLEAITDEDLGDIIVINKETEHPENSDDDTIKEGDIS